MKKVFSIVAVAAMVLFAGNANAQLRVNIGYGPMTYTTDNNGNESSFDMNGFFAGARYNTNITGDLNVSIGVDFRYGTKKDANGATLFGLTANSDVTKTQMIVDVPVLFNYGLNLNKDLKISAFAGPMISLALSGKTTSSAAVAGWGGSTEYDWYNDGDGKQLDLGLAFGLDLGFQKYRLFGGYNMGLLNLSSTDNVTRKSGGWFVGLGMAL